MIVKNSNKDHYIEVLRNNGFNCFPIPNEQKESDYIYNTSRIDYNQGMFFKLGKIMIVHYNHILYLINNVYRKKERKQDYFFCIHVIQLYFNEVIRNV